MLIEFFRDLNYVIVNLFEVIGTRRGTFKCLNINVNHGIFDKEILRRILKIFGSFCQMMMSLSIWECYKENSE